jgi:hypothetical protein
VAFIKTKMVPWLKFCPKLNRMPRQHQSHCSMYPIINFFIFFFKELKILKKNFKLKILGVAPRPTTPKPATWVGIRERVDQNKEQGWDQGESRQLERMLWGVQIWCQEHCWAP